jgi:hypothetical protein
MNEQGIGIEYSGGVAVVARFNRVEARLVVEAAGVGQDLRYIDKPEFGSNEIDQCAGIENLSIDPLLGHSRHAFSESKERLMFFRGTNKIYDPICHDDIALAKVGLGLLRQSGQDRRSDPSIRQLIIFRLGGRRRKRLDEIGTAYDTNKLAILENQDTLDPVFLEDIREFGERVFSSAEIMFPDMSSATLRPCDFA